MNKTIIKSLDVEQIDLDLPKSTELSIDHLCLESTKSTFSYLLNGNTKYRTEKYYDFEYGIHNIAQYNMIS